MNFIFICELLKRHNVGDHYLLSLLFHMDFFAAIFSFCFVSFLFFSVHVQVFVHLIESVVYIVCIMWMECNKNVVQCLLHFINLKTNFWSARANSHTRTFSFPLSLARLNDCILLLHLLSVMADWLMTDTNDNTIGCNTNYRQIEWKYLRCYFLSFCLLIPTAIECSMFDLAWFGLA